MTGGGGGPIDVRLEARRVRLQADRRDDHARHERRELSRRSTRRSSTPTPRAIEHIVERLKSDAPGRPAHADPALAVRRRDPQAELRGRLQRGPASATATSSRSWPEEERRDVADLNTSVVEATKKANATDHETAVKLNPDRVHPGPAGQLLMAEALLRRGTPPRSCPTVAIDAEARYGHDRENTKVTDLKAGGTITWTQEDEALPFPINLKDPATALAVQSSDVVEARPADPQGRRTPRRGVPPQDRRQGGRTFTREQLADGVNLAELATPMLRQAAEVHGLTLKHNNIHFARWRQVQVPLQDLNAEKVRCDRRPRRA